jgi:hypothetical protein
LYDKSALRAELERGGFVVQRLTFANFPFSLAAEILGRSPRAPTESTCGIPLPPGRVSGALGRLTLSAEAAAVRRGGRILWGHSLLAVATPG